MFKLIMILHLALSLNCSAIAAGDTLRINYSAMALDDSLALRIANDIQWITPINLAFSLKELLFDLKIHEPLAQKWRDKVKNYLTIFDDSLSYSIFNTEVEFFQFALDSKDTTISPFRSQLDLLKKHKFVPRSNGKPDEAVILGLLARYSDADNRKGISTSIFDYLVVADEHFLMTCSRRNETVKLIRRWLMDIEKNEFVVWDSINYDPNIIQRKRDFLVSKYEDSTNFLVREVIYSIKNAKISFIR